MTAVPADPFARRGERIGRLLPAPAVVVATLVALLAASGSDVSATRIGVGLGTATVALTWSLALVLRLDRLGPGMRIAAVAGQLGLGAVLAAVSGWFGIYIFTGYLLVDVLPRRVQRPAIALNAVILAAAQINGYPSDPKSLLLYTGLCAINIAVAIMLVTVAERTAAQNERLTAALIENAGLHEQLVTQAREAGVLDERQRLAGEIHDTLAQGLIGIVTQLEAAEQARHLPEQWQRHVTQARDLARSNLVDARRAVQALRPEQLDRGDLVTALRAIAPHPGTGTTRVTLDVVGDPVPLDDAVATALFRVGQEALSNALRHASASKVGLTLTFLHDPGRPVAGAEIAQVVLDVRDDGVGFDPDARAGGFGLPGMRRRVEGVGGRLEIETAPGDGVAISASVPA